jgi:hypothetical protein
MSGSSTQHGSNGFLHFYKEHPFAFGGATGMAGGAASLVMPWWAIALAALGGFVTGLLVDLRSE